MPPPPRRATVYRNMLAAGIRPSYESLQTGMNVARKSLRLEMCWYFFRQMRRFGYTPAEKDYNTLLACATQSRNLNVVCVRRASACACFVGFHHEWSPPRPPAPRRRLRVFREMLRTYPQASPRAYTTMISACASAKKLDLAFELFEQYRQSYPDDVAEHPFAALINACRVAGQPQLGLEVAATLRTLNVPITIVAAVSIMRVQLQVGDIEGAQEVRWAGTLGASGPSPARHRRGLPHRAAARRPSARWATTRCPASRAARC